MAFTKIQPQQLQLPTFLSPSGDITFTDNVTGVSANLNRTLYGDFNFSDSLRISSNEVITTISTNSSSSDSMVLGGTNNTVTGSYNVVLNGASNSSVSGSYNTLVNGRDNNFGMSGENNTIIGGDGVSFEDQTTGSVIIADHETAVRNYTNHSLLVSFNSGITFQNGTIRHSNGDFYHSGDNVWFDSHLQMNEDHSGVFSGSVYVGTLDVTGAAIFADSVTLEDSGEAVSDYWVGSRIIHDTADAVLAEVESFGSVPASNLENILTGSSAYTTVFTGHVVTGTNVSGPDIAYLVFTGPTFTGAIPFTGFTVK